MRSTSHSPRSTSTVAVAAAAALALATTASSPCMVDGFTFISSRGTSSPPTTSALRMGLFDGLKDAFTAPALERSVLDSERETPIDRWMGWNVKSSDDGPATQTAGGTASDDGFVDSMDPSNYVVVELAKPMGIVFEENDAKFGGIFVQTLKEGGIAAQNGKLRPGDQLVAVDSQKVSALPFDDALGAIIGSQEEKTKLILFRGNAGQLYGPTGASREWLDEFIASGGVEEAATA